MRPCFFSTDVLPPIAKMLGSTLIEWEGRISSAICLRGCNLRCPMCHSHDLIEFVPGAPALPLQQVLEHIAEQEGFVDGVVVSGGEPTAHSGLPFLLRKIRDAGVNIKLDTNGTMPEVLQQLVADDLVDYVALDIKSALDERYMRACGTTNAGVVRRVRKSLHFLMDGGVEYEFRTTVIPGLTGPDELDCISKEIEGGMRWYLQQFNPENALEPAMRDADTFSTDEIKAMAERFGCRVRYCFVRGFPANYGSAGRVCGKSPVGDA